MLNEKKCLCLFNKKTPLYAGLTQNRKKNFNNRQVTYQKELFLLFEKLGNFFHRANVQIVFTLPPPVRFCSLFKDPLPPAQQTYFLNDPV